MKPATVFAGFKEIPDVFFYGEQRSDEFLPGSTLENTLSPGKIRMARGLLENPNLRKANLLMFYASRNKFDPLLECAARIEDEAEDNEVMEIFFRSFSTRYHDDVEKIKAFDEWSRLCFEEDNDIEDETICNVFSSLAEVARNHDKSLSLLSSLVLRGNIMAESSMETLLESGKRRGFGGNIPLGIQKAVVTSYRDEMLDQAFNTLLGYVEEEDEEDTRTIDDYIDAWEYLLEGDDDDEVKEHDGKVLELPKSEYTLAAMLLAASRQGEFNILIEYSRKASEGDEKADAVLRLFHAEFARHYHSDREMLKKYNVWFESTWEAFEWSPGKFGDAWIDSLSHLQDLLRDIARKNDAAFLMLHNLYMYYDDTFAHLSLVELTEEEPHRAASKLPGVTKAIQEMRELQAGSKEEDIDRAVEAYLNQDPPDDPDDE
jgi:hypothetical protein